MNPDRLAGLRTVVAFVAAAGILAAAGIFASRDVRPWTPPSSAPPAIAELFSRRVDTLHPGETVSDLFSRQGLRRFSLSPLSSRALFDPRRLRPGLIFSFLRRHDDSLPRRVIFRANADQRVALHLTEAGWEASAEPIAWRSEPLRLEGRITSSFFNALDSAVDEGVLSSGERTRLVWDLADVFAWQVDFSRDLRGGDRFRVVAERLVAEDGEVRFGRILAGEVEVGGVTYSAYRWTGPDGSTGFFDADGRSLRRSFLLAPLEFRRVSSQMSAARLHPILGILRRHEGTDYAADPGTPVRAAGDGIVSRREWSDGYGNLVELRHANGITTRYGHLQGFAQGIAPGARVSQGEVIGYVGSTGLATGPHLHYEFRINGVARDPRDADLGTGNPVPLASHRDFDRERAHLAALLAGEGTALAAADAGDDPEGRHAHGTSF